VPAIVQAELHQDVGRVGARIGKGRPAVQGTDRDILQHAQPLERLHDLEGAADTGVADEVGPQPRDLPSVEAHAAGVGPVDAGDHVEDRGLAGAVGSDQGVDGTGRHVEGDVVHGAQAAEALADPVEFEPGAAHFCLSPKPRRSAIQGQTPAGRYITITSRARP